MGERPSTSTELQHSAATPIVAPASPALPAGPLEWLPDVGTGADPYRRLVTAFLVGYPAARFAHVLQRSEGRSRA